MLQCFATNSTGRLTTTTLADHPYWINVERPSMAEIDTLVRQFN